MHSTQNKRNGIVGQLRHKWAQLATLCAVLCLSLAPMAYAAGDAHFILNSSGSTDVGGTFTVTVSVSALGSDNANSVDAEITYPTSLLTLSSAAINPIFEAAPAGSGVGCASDNTSTSPISIACAASSAFSGTTQYATLSFTVKAAGSATIAVQSDSGVDGGSGGGQDIWDHQTTSMSQVLTGSSSGANGATSGSGGSGGGLSDTGIAIASIVAIALLTLLTAVAVRVRRSRSHT